MDDLLPPPPYTPQDYVIGSNQSISNPIDPSPIYTDLLDTTASIDPYPTNSIPNEATFTDNGSSFLSGHPNFITRAPTLPTPNTIISYRIFVNLKDNPEKLKYPEPSESFLSRGLSKQDWSTFINYLFPTHSSQTKERKFASDKKSSSGKLSKPKPVSAPSVSNSQDEEKEFLRRSEIHTLIQEWNRGFFLSRGLVIITIIQPYSSKQNELNPGSSSTETALSKAVSEGNFLLVQTLLFKGIDPNIKPPGDASALYQAVEKKHYSITQLLLQHGANIDSKTLHLAASRGDTQTLTLLLSHGANPEDKPWGEFSALFNAAQRSDIPTMRLLLAYGANADYTPWGQHSALYYAIQRKDKPALQLLLDHGADPDLKPWGGQPPIHLAASQGELDMLRLLVAKGANVDAAPAMLDTALGVAVSRGDVAAATLLLESGADVNVKPWGGQTPLYCAAGKGDARLMVMLLEKGADVNDAPLGCPSALCMAVQRGDVETAKVLIGHGADVNTNTPLAIAVSQSHVPLVELLLENGADVNLKPWGGQHPLYCAASKGDTPLMLMLLEKGAKVDDSPFGVPSALYMAVYRGDAEAVKVLLSHGADMNKKSGGQTALSCARLNGNENVLKVLSQYQAAEEFS